MTEKSTPSIFEELFNCKTEDDINIIIDKYPDIFKDSNWWK